MTRLQELRKLEKKFKKLEDQYDRCTGKAKEKVFKQAERLQIRIDHLKG